jgi:hypothetical protein
MPTTGGAGTSSTVNGRAASPSMDRTGSLRMLTSYSSGNMSFMGGMNGSSPMSMDDTAMASLMDSLYGSGGFSMQSLISPQLAVTTSYGTEGTLGAGGGAATDSDALSEADLILLMGSVTSLDQQLKTLEHRIDNRQSRTRTACHCSSSPNVVNINTGTDSKHHDTNILPPPTAFTAQSYATNAPASVPSMIPLSSSVPSTISLPPLVASSSSLVSLDTPNFRIRVTPSQPSSLPLALTTPSVASSYPPVHPLPPPSALSTSLPTLSFPSSLDVNRTWIIAPTRPSSLFVIRPTGAGTSSLATSSPIDSSASIPTVLPSSTSTSVSDRRQSSATNSIGPFKTFITLVPPSS